MKELRVDVFLAKEHKKYYFDSVEEANHFAFALPDESIAFLLRLVIDSKYEVVHMY